MNKKVQLLISFVLLLCCISIILYSITFNKEENIRTSYREANAIIQKDKNIDNTSVYDAFLKSFNCQGQKYDYSFIELAGYDDPILLLSNGVYKFKDESEVALWTDIYYPVNNQITKFGTIGSSGTAYPISADTTGIYTAGGHEVEKYDLDIENRKLKLISKYIMLFYKVEQEVRVITIGIVGDENKIVSEEEFNKAYKEYENTSIIYFKRLS